jgi:nucleotide-binding universal stress UspA family protein
MKTKLTNAPETGTAPASLKLNHVLVPIDFSSGSKKALQYAIHFAKQFDAGLVLLHVLPKQAATDKELASRLKAWAQEFVPNQIALQIQISRGAEALEIVNAAKKYGTGLMVISTHGRTGRAHALAGSLAENLVQLAPCPVLVVRENEQDFIETDDAKKAQVPSFLGASI